MTAQRPTCGGRQDPGTRVQVQLLVAPRAQGAQGWHAPSAVPLSQAWMQSRRPCWAIFSGASSTSSRRARPSGPPHRARSRPSCTSAGTTPAASSTGRRRGPSAQAAGWRLPRALCYDCLQPNWSVSAAMHRTYRAVSEPCHAPQSPGGCSPARQALAGTQRPSSRATAAARRRWSRSSPLPGPVHCSLSRLGQCRAAYAAAPAAVKLRGLREALRADVCGHRHCHAAHRAAQAHCGTAALPAADDLPRTAAAAEASTREVSLPCCAALCCAAGKELRLLRVLACLQPAAV